MWLGSRVRRSGGRVLSPGQGAGAASHAKTHTVLSPTVLFLAGPNLQSTGATTSAGGIQIEAASAVQAQLSVMPHASDSHGHASGLAISVPAAVYGSQRSAVGEEIAGYQFTVTASDPTAVRLGPAACPAPFTGCGANVDQHAGTKRVAAAVYQDVAPPRDLAFVPVRLTGPVTEAALVTTTLQRVVDQHDTVPETPTPVMVLRGAVYPACSSSGDAVALQQYLAGLRGPNMNLLDGPPRRPAVPILQSNPRRSLPPLCRPWKPHSRRSRPASATAAPSGA